MHNHGNMPPCSVFVDVSEREQKEGNHRRLIEEKRIEKDMMQYNEWMRKGGEDRVLQLPPAQARSSFVFVIEGSVCYRGVFFVIVGSVCYAEVLLYCKQAHC